MIDGAGERGLMVQEREDRWCRRERMDGEGERDKRCRIERIDAAGEKG